METLDKRLPEDFLRQMAEAIKILGHPQRLRIVDLLDLRGEVCTGEISELCSLPQAVASQHLNQMRRAGLVAFRKAGTQVFYSLSSIQPKTIIDCLRKKYAQVQK